MRLASGTEIKNFNSLIEALDKRHKFFHEQDAGYQTMVLTVFIFRQSTLAEIDRIFKKLLKEEIISPEETEKYKTAIMLELCRMNHKRGWTQQFHVGAIRNNNSRMFRQMGPIQAGIQSEYHRMH